MRANRAISSTDELIEPVGPIVSTGSCSTITTWRPAFSS
jgi:hypothetical protein